jgi:hypothetical protein
MSTGAHRAPIDLKKRPRHQGSACRMLLRPCSNLQGPIPAPRDDVNAAKSADMSERSEV